MKISGDYHTHTTYSHGKGSVLDNALAAKRAGISEIAIADHGFAHPFFGLKRKKLPLLIEDCRAATENTGVKVLVGVESNFISKSGLCDLSADLYGMFEVFLAGAHVCVKYADFSAFYGLCVYSPSRRGKGKTAKPSIITATTDMYVNAVKTQPIDVITHLGFRVFADYAEVAAACKSEGTYIEINTKKTHLTDEEWASVADTGVNFVIGSDAHSPDRVGDDAEAFRLIERVGIPLERVHNVDRLPDFRFKRFKEGGK